MTIVGPAARPAAPRQVAQLQRRIGQLKARIAFQHRTHIPVEHRLIHHMPQKFAVHLPCERHRNQGHHAGQQGQRHGWHQHKDLHPRH